MNESAASVSPEVILKSDAAVGLFIHYDKAAAANLQERLESDRVNAALNPPEAARLAQPGKAVFVFGRRHPRVVAAWLELVGEEVVIDPDLVMAENPYPPPVDQLLLLGEPGPKPEEDYAALGISERDVPALIRMATDDDLHDRSPESAVVWAPVHAWRALEQLRAEEAIAPLMALFRRADQQDDWVSDDLPEVIAQFGASALAPATEYLANPTHGDWARIAAARTIGLVGQRHPELRADCVARLSAQLERFAEQSETLNAFLVLPLWDLRAVEAMPVIDRAFASGRVDESAVGDVEDVQIEFGLKERREHPRKPNRLTVLGDMFRATWQAAGLPLPDADGNVPEPDDGPDDGFAGPDAGPPALPAPCLAPPKTGRNEPCPCGSGKKYKKCCGR